MGILSLLEPHVKKYETKIQVSLIDQLFMVLKKLRLDTPFDAMASHMGLHKSTVSRIFHKWIDVMARELNCLIMWPDEEALHLNLPTCFWKHYSQVKCIIDCFKVNIERPISFKARAATYSSYKKHNTIKVLLAVAHTGAITFISHAYGGRISDKELTQRCGLLNLIKYAPC